MAFDLKSIQKTKTDRPPRVLIYGPHKIGKSTFGSMAPSPIFIQTEDGLDNIDAEAFPLAASWADVMEAVGTLYGEAHKFKSVVIDSLDWAERLAQAAVAADHNVDGIEGIGYGKGYVYTADKFRQLLDGLNALRLEKGMTVVALCHAEIKRFDDPLADSYDRYQIKLHKLVGKMVQEWADVIGFAQEEAFTKNEKRDGFDKEGRNRTVGTGKRVLRLGVSAAYDAGNRYSLPDTVDFNWPAFEAAMTEARK
jgi:hypothetical protein